MSSKYSFLILSLALIACDTSINNPSSKTYSAEDSGKTNADNSNNADDTQDSGETGSEDTVEIEPTIENLQQAGAYTYSEEMTSLSVASCGSAVSLTHVQTSKEAAPTVFLAHGFARSSSNMLDWAHHWASWGFDIVVVNSCHFTDHAQNAQVLVELAEGLNISTPIFAGQSAGGLASFIAGSKNANALGVLGLDATDDMSSSGLSVASQVSVPVLGLIGESSMCNSENNGLNMFQAASNSTLLRVVDADHCDFEFPTDGVCTAFCQNSAAIISDEEIHKTILSLSTAGLLWLSDSDSTASDLWDGSQKQALLNTGAISEID